MIRGYGALFAMFAALAAHGDVVGVSPVKGNATPNVYSADGFYRVRQDDGGRWWVVAPDGGRTFLRGVDHANWNGHWCEALNVNPYREENRKRYPSQGAWEAETLDRLKSWGFNTLGAGCSPELEGRGLAHCAFLSMGESFASQGGDHALSEAQGIPGTAFPNVFHKDWEGFCDARAAQLCASRKDDRSLVGYFFDNELYWWGRTAEEAERYFGTIAAAIRRHDPNHLLLGCRFAGLDAPRAAWEAAGRYCDIVTFNQYSWADIDENVVYTSRDSGVRAADAYEERYSWTKKPLMITEWSFPSLDSGLPCTGGAGQRFRTQAMRVKATELFARTLFALPFMVGSDYFMWVDEPALGISRKFPENSNYGLVDGCGKPYADLTAMFSRLNPEADALHERGEMPSARTVDRQEEERKALFPEFAADSSASCVRDGDAYTLSTGAGLVLKGRVGGSAAFDSVVADGVECGPFTFMLYHGVWEDIGRVESAEWIRKAGALRIAGTGGSGGRTFRVVCDIVPIAGKPWFACNVVSAENTGTEEFADASVWLRQYSPWAADSWRTGGERSVPFLWKSPDCGAWIRSGDGAWCGAATFARTVRAFRYWISGDGATHPDAAFGEAGPLRLTPGGKWTPEGRAWMVAAAGKGGEKGWRGFLDDFAAWRDEALTRRAADVALWNGLDGHSQVRGIR